MDKIPPKISEITNFKLSQKAYHSKYGEVIVKNIRSSFKSRNEIHYRSKCHTHGYATLDGYARYQDKHSGLVNKVLFTSKEEMIKYFQNNIEVEL